jgi:hypothetical protein
MLYAGQYWRGVAAGILFLRILIRHLICLVIALVILDSAYISGRLSDLTRSLCKEVPSSYKVCHFWC